MRKSLPLILLLIAVLLSGRMAVAMHDVQHGLPQASAHVCDFCVHAGGLDGPVSDLRVLALLFAPLLWLIVAPGVTPLVAAHRRYRSRAPPAVLV